MAGRALTPGEIKLAKLVYKTSLDYTKVKIHDKPYIPFQPKDSGMTPNGEIYMSGTAYKADYSAEDLRTRSFFIHEMAHVWQYQTGVLNPIVSAIREQIRHLGDYSKAYKFKLDPAKDLTDYGMEQQAEILESYYQSLTSSGALPPSPTGTPNSDLQKVLKNFIRDPGYAKVYMKKKEDKRMKEIWAPISF